MQKPALATVILGLAWALSRLPKGGRGTWLDASHGLDRRFPNVLAILGRPRPRRRPRPEAGGVPVDPNRPNHLSGGAAAVLEFDRD